MADEACCATPGAQEDAMLYIFRKVLEACKVMILQEKGQVGMEARQFSGLMRGQADPGKGWAATTTVKSS